MKILLAIDGSACSDLAIREVAQRPWPPGSVVRILSVIEPVAVATPEAVLPSDCYFDAMERAAQGDMRRAIMKINQGGNPQLRVEPVVCTGYPKQIILDEAEAWGADLVVIGSHGRGMAGRFLLGSVSQSVARNAKCPVEIVRCRESYREA